MKPIVVACALMASLPSRARAGDEIVLSDGRSLAWKSISRAGDVFEVVLEDGQRLKVQRSEIVKIAVLAPRAPLAGAAFTGKPLPPVDLFGRIDPKRDAAAGQWKFAGGALRSVSSNVVTPSVLSSSYAPPAEYDLTVVVERAEGREGFLVGLVAGGKDFGVIFDKADGTTSGLFCIDSSGPEYNETGTKQKDLLLPKGKARTIFVQIRKAGLAVHVDGKPLFEWREYGRITPATAWEPAEKGKLWLAAMTYGTSFKISRAWVVPYREDPK